MKFQSAQSMNPHGGMSTKPPSCHFSYEVHLRQVSRQFWGIRVLTKEPVLHLSFSRPWKCTEYNQSRVEENLRYTPVFYSHKNPTKSEVRDFSRSSNGMLKPRQPRADILNIGPYAFAISARCYVVCRVRALALSELSLLEAFANAHSSFDRVWLCL